MTDTAAPLRSSGAGRALVGRVSGALSPRKVGAVYVLIAISIIFSFTAPDTFPKTDTIRQVANTNAVGALAALALVIPLAAGVFDISTAYTMSLSGVVVAYTLIHTNQSVLVACLLAMLASLCVGIVNGFVVVFLKLDSLIATLATGSLIQATISLITNEQNQNSPKLLGSFSKLASNQIDGFTYPVFYAVLVALVLWFILEYTVIGRQFYATGFNLNAAKLAGVNTIVVRFLALVTASVLAGFAGIVLASNIGSGSPTAGTPYLLSAFAAVFLGATQFKEGRFNAWGTLLAVVILGVGVTGLGLSGAAQWTGSMFVGVVLIAALAVTGLQRRKAGFAGRRTRTATVDSAPDSGEDAGTPDVEKRLAGEHV